MEKLARFLRGKKTYVIAAAVALLTFAHHVGWLDTQTYQFLVGLLGAGAVATLRAGIKNG